MKDNDAPAFGDDVMPGSRLRVQGRARQGETASTRGSRKRPPSYGTRDSATRVTPVLDQAGPLRSDNDRRKHNLRRAYGRSRGDPRNAPGNRHFGEFAKSAQLAGLLARKAELTLVMSVMKQQQHLLCARSFGLSDDDARYFSPAMLEHFSEQRDRERSQAAKAALAKQHDDFWSGWLKATKALSR
jgi:hypothetical protein